MTLSNFSWTDKNSVKWFIMHPTGHVGPYSLNALTHFLSQGKIQLESNIWAEGLDVPLSLGMALEYARPVPVSAPVSVPHPDGDLPPPLPPIPEEDYPDFPLEETPAPVKPLSLYPYVFGTIVAGLVLFFTLSEVIKSRENISIRRHPKMSPGLHAQILRDLRFDGFNKKIFFKEYSSPDLSHIWLVTSGFQKCQVEATFTSVPGKLLALKDENISFKSKGKLLEHVTEFSSFEFSSGTKIRPGLYSMDLAATHCEWDGFIPKLVNWFKDPESSYQARMNVVLFSKGAKDFSSILGTLVRKKSDLEAVNTSKEEAFWQDVQQKLQTLLAIALQIEQLLLDFSEKAKPSFPSAAKSLVDEYTKKYGHFLTNFVVSNETSFKEMNVSQLKDPSKKRNYEIVVKLAAKNIGHETMRIIEELQRMKAKPTAAEMKKFDERVRASFSELKKQLNQKIIQISEDRST
ncbi:MAG TPA: DUF4339 domain-containing protein [Bacteriovoracaceae bacterium]|nr:DUF4339 domain-containing protein [Bacteriovoracaceae bacterium]